MNTLIFFLQGCFLEVGLLAVPAWQTGPISWGEHTLIPSLRVDPQKKFFYPQKSRQGLDGPVLGQTDDFSGESVRSALVRRKSTMEEHWLFLLMGPRARGLVWGLGGGQTGKKFWDCPLVGYVLGCPGTKTESLCLASMWRGGFLKFEGNFPLNGCHITENGCRDIPFSHLGSQTCRVPGSLGKSLIGVYAFFSWDPSPFSWGWWPRPPWKNFNWAPHHPMTS